MAPAFCGLCPGRYTKLAMRFSQILLILLLASCSGEIQNDSAWYESAIRYQSTGKPGDLYWEDFASGENASLDTPLKAFEILLNTQIFSHSRVGMMQYPSIQGKALNVVMEQPAAKEAFVHLIEKGHIAGQLYGLCGLYYLSKSDFDNYAKSYVTSKEKIWVEYYDNISSFSVKDIIAEAGELAGEVCSDFIE